MKKVLILFLCIALILPILLSATPLRAADSYLITIAEDVVLDDTSDNGMAVYIDGIIYIPYTTLSKLDDVYAIYNQAEQAVTVYRYKSIAVFELDTGLTYDAINNRTALVSAKMRNGVPYIPVSILSSWMNMYLSFISTDQSGVSYPIIRLCGNTPSLSDDSCLRRNSAKLKTVAKARDIKSGHVTPEPLPPRKLAIMFTAIPQSQENATSASLLSNILDSLIEYKLQASFFFTEEQLLPNFESIREIYARGCSSGIMLTDPEKPLEQALRCSEMYAQMLHVRIRLVCAPDLELTDKQKAELTDAGFLYWEPDHEPDSGDIGVNKLISATKTALKNAESKSTIRFYINDTTLAIIPTLYSYLIAQNYTTEPMNEWTQPF